MSGLRRAVDDRDWVRGAPEGAVTLLEYGDYECPFCARAFWERKKLERAPVIPFRFAFRHFPLSQLHPHATLAAEAAEAAGAQGKFWEMHDTLFRNQQNLTAQALLDYASELDLDLGRFETDLQQHRHVPKVRRDFFDGVRSGVNGTPTFFIDGVRWNGPYTAEGLLAGLRGQAAPDVEPMTGLPWEGGALPRRGGHDAPWFRF
jgi:protein-disulfide isomerase